jgi:hypothetical protein
MTKAAKPTKVVEFKKRTKKTEVGTVPAAGRTVTAADNDPKRESFLQHRPSWVAAQAKLKAAQAIVNEVVAALKQDGHTKKEMQIADLFAGNRRQELRIVADVEAKQRVAQYMGHWLGNQMDLFAQSKAAAPNPYEEGKTAYLEGKRASPPRDYVAGSPFYTRWLEGYHDAQEAKVRKGIRPLAGDGTLEDKPPAAEEDEGDDGNPVAEVGERNPARRLSDFH